MTRTLPQRVRAFLPLILLAACQSGPQVETGTVTNPLLAPWTGPYG